MWQFLGRQRQISSPAPATLDNAKARAQQYLDTNLSNAKDEMTTHFYGYYTFDFTINEKTAGMLSGNAYTDLVSLVAPRVHPRDRT